MQMQKGQSSVSVNIGEDSAVRVAVLVNIAVEAFVALATLALMFSTLHGEGFEFSGQLTRWRNKIFGPPPPSEEDIERYARLAVVEAMRILREEDA